MPFRVAGTLNEPITDLSAGDCHSIAYNTEKNVIYYWGCYKAVVSGKPTTKIETPTRIGQDLFSDKSK